MFTAGSLRSTLSSTLCDGQSEFDHANSEIDSEVISPPQRTGTSLVDESVLEGMPTHNFFNESLPRPKAHQHSQYRAPN